MKKYIVVVRTEDVVREYSGIQYDSLKDAEKERDEALIMFADACICVPMEETA